MTNESYMPAAHSLAVWIDDIENVKLVGIWPFWLFYLRDNIAAGRIACKGFKDGQQFPEKVDPQLVAYMRPHLLDSEGITSTISLMPVNPKPGDGFHNIQVRISDMEPLKEGFNAFFAFMSSAFWMGSKPDVRKFFNMWADLYLYEGMPIDDNADRLAELKETLVNSWVREVEDNPEILSKSIQWATDTVNLCLHRNKLRNVPNQDQCEPDTFEASSALSETATSLPMPSRETPDVENQNASQSGTSKLKSNPQPVEHKQFQESELRVVSDAEAREWYQEHVREWLQKHPIVEWKKSVSPSRDDEADLAVEKFGFLDNGQARLSRNRVIILRSEFAPKEWKIGGRPKGGQFSDK